MIKVWKNEGFWKKSQVKSNVKGNNEKKTSEFLNLPVQVYKILYIPKPSNSA